MSGELRHDLFRDLLKQQECADLCVAMGTSLAGMNADRVVTTVSERAQEKLSNQTDLCQSLLAGKDIHDVPLGSVIINLQKTSIDDQATLRIFAKCDDVMEALSKVMDIPPAIVPSFVPDENATTLDDVFRIPYGSDGLPLPKGDSPRVLDMREGAKVRITAGTYAGDEGEVVGVSKLGHYQIRFMHTIKKNWKVPMTHTLGRWFIGEGLAGLLNHFPVESVDPCLKDPSPQLSDVKLHSLREKNSDTSSGLKNQKMSSAVDLPDWVQEEYRNK